MMAECRMKISVDLVVAAAGLLLWQRKRRPVYLKIINYLKIDRAHSGATFFFYIIQNF
jgi:hypothetical protein